MLMTIAIVSLVTFGIVTSLGLKVHNLLFFAKRNFAIQGKASEQDEAVVTYGDSTESML